MLQPIPPYGDSMTATNYMIVLTGQNCNHCEHDMTFHRLVDGKIGRCDACWDGQCLKYQGGRLLHGPVD